MAPPLGAGGGLNQNQGNVANALNNFFNSGGTGIAPVDVELGKEALPALSH